MTETKLREKEPPYMWSEWLLRTMIVSPGRICDPDDLAAWKKAHPAPYRKDSTKRDRYGLTGSR
jgi:hypothetical protein